jgi:hypothetical protein
MKRSFLMSALVLALASAMAMTACGSSTPGATDSGDKKDDSGGTSGPASTGDPVADAKAISDNLQKEIDDALQPLKDADATLDSIAKLPTDLKAAKGFNKAKVMAQVQLVVGGGDADIDSLGITDADAKQKLTDRITKLKALVASIKGIDDSATKIVKDIGDAIPKLAANVAKAIGPLQVKIKAPFGVSADDKAKATADMKTLTDIKDGFEAKAAGWKKDLTDLAAKAKTLPGKLAALK